MSTAGQRSRLVTTERTPLSLADFAKEIIKFDGDSGMSESTNILVYGDSDAGKTVLAGSLPEKTFWLVCEPGYKSAIRWRQREGLPPHRGARRIANTAEAWAAVDWLETGEKYRKLDWLVVDGASTMQDRFRLSYTAEAFDRDPTKRAHRNLPDRPDYFNTQNFLKAWFPRLVDMPVNLLVTAHPYRTNNTEDGELLVFPGFQGKGTEVSNAITGLMDVTGYMEKRRKTVGTEVKTQRRIWFQPPAGRGNDDQEVRFIVGDKFGVLPDYITAPTMEKIQSYINGEGQNA